MFLLKIPLYTLRSSLEQRYSCDSGLIYFHCLYKLSRNCIDFKIPQVIHLLSLCLCLLNLTVFWKEFIFCFGYGLFQDRIRNIKICSKVTVNFSLICTVRMSFLNILIWSSFNLRIFINLGVWTLCYRRFLLVAHGQWSDMRDFTTIVRT